MSSGRVESSGIEVVVVPIKIASFIYVSQVKNIALYYNRYVFCKHS